MICGRNEAFQIDNSFGLQGNNDEEEGDQKKRRRKRETYTQTPIDRLEMSLFSSKFQVVSNIPVSFDFINVIIHMTNSVELGIYVCICYF